MIYIRYDSKQSEENMMAECTGERDVRNLVHVPESDSVTDAE